MTDAARASARLSADLSAHTSARLSVSPPQAGTAARPVPRAATTVPLPTLLHAITEAYAAGNAALGERLFLKALNEQLPWDVACAAAARGIAARRDGPPRA